MIVPNKFTYEGYFKDDKFDGEGIYKDHENEDIFDGEWKDNL